MVELERRRKIRPLEFFKRLPMHEKVASDSSYWLKLIFGGNRSGKSEGVAEYVLKKIENAKKKFKVWVVGETFQDSIAIQQRKIWDLCPKDQIRYGRYDEINGFTNRKLLFKQGHIITFKSYDQGREAFQADDIDLIWNDEEPPLEVVKEQKMRLIDRNGEMIVSMTSIKGVTDFLTEFYEECDIVQSQYAPLLGKELPRIAEKNGARMYFLWTPENQHINQERVQQEARQMTPLEIGARIYGLPTNLIGRVYPKFSKHVHVIQDGDIPSGQFQLWNILDPHDQKPWAICWIAIHKGTNACYVVDEYPNKNFNEMPSDDKTYGEYVSIIKQKEAELEPYFGPVVKRIIDPNFGNKTVQLAERQGGQAKTTPREELKKRGLTYKDGIDTIEAGHLAVRQALHYTVRDGQIVVQPTIYFLEFCQNTIRHMSRYAYKERTTASGDEKDKVGPQDKYKDFCDLVRYFKMANPRFMETKPFKPEAKKAY